MADSSSIYSSLDMYTDNVAVSPDVIDMTEEEMEYLRTLLVALKALSAEFEANDPLYRMIQDEWYEDSGNTSLELDALILTANSAAAGAGLKTLQGETYLFKYWVGGNNSYTLSTGRNKGGIYEVISTIETLIAMHVPASGGSSMSPIDAGMDIEMMMMVVQINRATALEESLKMQMKEVQKRNEKIQKLNALYTALNNAIERFGATSEEKTQFWELFPNPPNAGWDGHMPFEIAVNGAARAAGFTSSDGSIKLFPTNHAWSDTNYGFSRHRSKSEIKMMAANIKTMVDSEGTSSQLDMLRLQALSNKSNEAWTLASSYVKKVDDTRGGIVRNI